MNTPHYQVMCTWGLSGALRSRFTPDLYIWVDALSAFGTNPEEIQNLPGNSPVLAADIADAFAVADWVTEFQLSEKKRLSVLVVCADDKLHSIADQLAAGAVIERLAHNGIDAMSPEAAVANAAYSQLNRATAHLVKASEAATQVHQFPHTLSVDESLTVDSVRILRH